MFNYLLATLRVPCVALLNGVCMGAGVGLAVHSRYRVATEKTVLAMPETLIGAFPGWGIANFFSQLPGQLGLYMGLTGQPLKGRIWLCISVYGLSLIHHKCLSQVGTYFLQDWPRTTVIELGLVHSKQPWPNTVQSTPLLRFR